MSVITIPTPSAGSNALLDGSAHTDTLAGSVARGDVIYGNSTPKWARLAKPSTRQVLVNDGTDVAWGVPTTGESTKTTTGNIDDLDFSNASILRMNNASDATIRGLVAGVSGQQVTIVSVGAGNVYLAHQNTNSAAANRLINFATSGNTPLAAGKGVATLEYDDTTDRWRLVSHNQGAAIAVAYAAGDFTTTVGTWTVDAGDVIDFSYSLVGNILTVWFDIRSTTTTGTPGALDIKIPGGFTGAGVTKNMAAWGYDNGTPVVTLVQPTSTDIRNFRYDLAAWANSVNVTQVRGTSQIAVS